MFQALLPIVWLNLFKRLNLNIPVYLGANEALKEPSKAWRQRLDESVKNISLGKYKKS